MRLPVESVPIDTNDLFANPPMHVVKEATNGIRNGLCAGLIHLPHTFSVTLYSR